MNWVKVNYPYGQTDPNRRIYFTLDNEPDLWAESHPEVYPKKVTYAELIERTIPYATAIKRVEPNTLVYGPANYGWNGFTTLQNAPDADGRDFQEFYLAEMARAGAAAGKRLIDVLDVHFYPEATGGGVRIIEAGFQAGGSGGAIANPALFVGSGFYRDKLDHEEHAGSAGGDTDVAGEDRG